MGHEDGSVQARYPHVTPVMRARLLEGLTEAWEAALAARREMRIARRRSRRPPEDGPIDGGREPNLQDRLPGFSRETLERIQGRFPEWGYRR